MTSVILGGGLGYVLLISRIMGVYAISLRSTNNGYYIKFSNAAVFYSHCCLAISCKYCKIRM